MPLFHQCLGVKFSLKSKHRKSKKFHLVYRAIRSVTSGNNYIPGPLKYIACNVRYLFLVDLQADCVDKTPRKLWANENRLICKKNQNIMDMESLSSLKSTTEEYNTLDYYLKSRKEIS